MDVHLKLQKIYLLGSNCTHPLTHRYHPPRHIWFLLFFVFFFLLHALLPEKLTKMSKIKKGQVKGRVGKKTTKPWTLPFYPYPHQKLIGSMKCPGNPFSGFCVIPLTNQPTNKHNLLGKCNNWLSRNQAAMEYWGQDFLLIVIVYSLYKHLETPEWSCRCES